MITLNIAGYTRISVDIEQDHDNTSIENQKKIIEDYVAEHFPTASLTMYTDRDRSGYTFQQREDYQRMRARLLSGESTVLIVKDFSRFSRRNSLGLLELETLRDAGVRIISINDGIDYPTKDDWMLIQFKFLMNEMPVTDTSKKIKAIIQHRQKSGEWVCAVPYGYRMINTKEMTYELDPPAAEVVREIFDLYNSGWGYKRIANYLTDKGIPTPRANEIAWREAQGQHTKLKSKAEWSIISVSSILSNDFYVGTLRQKKYTRTKINGKDRRLEEEDHIVIENAHIPIIDARTFAYTREQLKLRSRSHYRGEKKYATDYSGYLFCGDCGAPMFSMSRPDLAPAYTCGTYHRRGRKGCSSHHIRVDKLDELLKRYVQVVRDNSASMLDQLQKAIKQQPEREQEIGNAIDSLERQLAESKEQLKALYKRKLIDTIGKAPDEVAIIDEAYTELEKDLTRRIAGLEHQIDANIDSRNHLLQANRAAKTVIEVFNDILAKPKLDKRDISLIVDRITVYEDHIDIQLKADIDGLLATGVWEEPKNFPQGSKDISNLPQQIVQSAPRRPDKVFTVNVINSGDPLEIYTDKDGGVIFKKYSLMGGLSDFAGQMCETLNKTTGRIAVITDRDTCISVAGTARRELADKRISAELENIMEGRQIYQRKEANSPLPICEDTDKYLLDVAAPILSEGDVLGCVLFVAAPGDAPTGETEYKLAQTIAGFLGRHMET
ncbi:stage V sporulation T C-terminal domain-containing protein [Intestinimonas butyriciproducens]|uniref:stage V sporulation T C-terminal domain-containing protein n=1 Tax=Intestinimonas butyriciproducens TaxID=1297617 RepID=UPI0034E48F15